VLTPEPISQDKAGNLYAIWVDDKYVLRMSKSTNNALNWSKPIVISAPSENKTLLMSYHPILIHHPMVPGRAAIGYYGSSDKGATWDAYMAETGNIDEQFPVFSNVIANEKSQPMQKNVDPAWDQGYRNPFLDLIEFIGLRYHPKTGDLVGAFARKMCSAYVLSVSTFDVKTCANGWDFHKHDDSAWQGYVAFARH
jgi:hypothetical protein